MNTFPNKTILDEAARRIEPFIHRTPIHTSDLINSIAGCELFFKCENLQRAGAFKYRGATNVVYSLTKDELNRGVCTHSSGNHAGALARAARTRKVKAHIVMPDNSSCVKIDAVRNYGGKIHFCSPNLASRESTLKKVQKNTGAVEVHPYNDYRIIAGQATAARELIEDVQNLDIVMAPVGGGGLLSGTALSTHFFAPKTKVIAAEPKGADDAFRSFKSGKFIPSENPVTIADGLLTSLGSLTFPIIQQFVDDILTVDEESLIRAMRLVWERMKLIIEPSSAVPLAAVLDNPEIFRDKRTGIIISGGNVDLTKLPW